MSAHRVVSSCSVAGVERRLGHIVFYDGPMRAELEPLDASEHSAWVKAGHWRDNRSLSRKLGEPNPPPALPEGRH